MVQFASDASVLENITFDLFFLSKYSLNSLLDFVLDLSGSLFTTRISNSSLFPTHTLSNTAFAPCPLWQLFLPDTVKTSFLPFFFSLSLTYLSCSFPSFSLPKIVYSLYMILSSTSVSFCSRFCHILYINPFQISSPCRKELQKISSLFSLYLYYSYKKMNCRPVHNQDHLFHSASRLCGLLPLCGSLTSLQVK